VRLGAGFGLCMWRRGRFGLGVRRWSCLSRYLLLLLLVPLLHLRRLLLVLPLHLLDVRPAGLLLRRPLVVLLLLLL